MEDDSEMEIWGVDELIPDTGPPITNTADRQAIAGGIAAGLSRSFIHPLDVVKTRLALQMEPLGQSRLRSIFNTFLDNVKSRLQVHLEPLGIKMKSKYRSALHAFQVIYREEGPKALWKGHNTTQIKSVAFGMTSCWMYGKILAQVNHFDMFQQNPVMTSFLVGSLSESTAVIVTMPLDVVRTRLIAQDSGKGYRNGLDGIVEISRTEGIRGLYRGLSSALWKSAPAAGINFMLFNTLTQLAADAIDVDKANELPTLCLLPIAASVGVTSKSLFYPLDLIRKRLQIQGFESNRQTFGENMKIGSPKMLECVKATVEREGVKGLYKGMTPALFKSAIATAFQFGFYEKIVQGLDR